MTLAATIAEYLRNPTDERIADTKTAVVSALKTLNSGAEFKTTDYFNHSFVPDIVGTWPDEGDTTEERFIFLRPSSHPSFVSADLGRLAELNATFVTLSEDDPGLDEVESSIENPVGDSLISNTYALETLGAEGGRLRKEWLVSALFLRRGRGVLGQDEAAAVDQAAAGFEAATMADRHTVSESLDVFSAFLQDDAAATVNRAMYYLWKGATPESYPGIEPLEGLLEHREIAEVLRYLLQRAQAGSRSFWERFADRVTLEDLEGLHGLDPTENLQLLMAFAATSLRARGVHVDVESHQPSFGLDQPFRWSIRERMLQLSNDKAIFRITADLRRFRGVNPRLPGPSMERLRERLAALRLGEVAIRTAGLHADLKLESDGPSVSRSLDDVVADIDVSAEVQRASIQPEEGGPPFECDFQRAVLHAADDSTEPISSLVLISARLLASLDTNEMGRLRESLGLIGARHG